MALGADEAQEGLHERRLRDAPDEELEVRRRRDHLLHRVLRRQTTQYVAITSLLTENLTAAVLNVAMLNSSSVEIWTLIQAADSEDPISVFFSCWGFFNPDSCLGKLCCTLKPSRSELSGV